MSPPPPYGEEDNESDFEFDDDFESDSDDDTANNTARWPDPNAPETEESEQASQPDAGSPSVSRPSTSCAAPSKPPRVKPGDEACVDTTENFNEMEISVLESSAFNEVVADVLEQGAAGAPLPASVEDPVKEVSTVEAARKDVFEALGIFTSEPVAEVPLGNKTAQNELSTVEAARQDVFETLGLFNSEPKEEAVPTTAAQLVTDAPDRFTTKSLETTADLPTISVPRPGFTSLQPNASNSAVAKPHSCSRSASPQSSEPLAGARQRASVAEQIRAAQARKAQETTNIKAAPPAAARPPKLPSRKASASQSTDVAPENPLEAEDKKETAKICNEGMDALAQGLGSGRLDSAIAACKTSRGDIKDAETEIVKLKEQAKSIIISKVESGERDAAVAQAQEEKACADAKPSPESEVESSSEDEVQVFCTTDELTPNVETAPEIRIPVESGDPSVRVQNSTPVVTNERRPSQPAMAIEDLLAGIKDDLLQNGDSPANPEEALEDDDDENESGFFISAGFAPQEADEPQAVSSEGPSAILTAYVAATGALVAPTLSPEATPEEKENAILKMQSLYRGRAARKAVDERRLQRRQEEIASVKIQSTRRGHLARRQLAQEAAQTKAPAPLHSPTASETSNATAVDEELRRREALEAQLRAQLEAKQLIMQAVLKGVFAAQAHQAQQASERAAQEKAEVAAQKQAEAEAQLKQEQEAAVAEAEAAASREAAEAAATAEAAAAEELVNKAVEESRMPQRPASRSSSIPRTSNTQKRGSRQIRVAKRKEEEDATQKQKRPPVPRAPRNGKTAQQEAPAKPQKRPPVPRAPRPKRTAGPNQTAGTKPSQVPSFSVPDLGPTEEEITQADLAEEGGIFEVSEEEFERLVAAGLLQLDGSKVEADVEGEVFEVSEEEFARLVQEGLALQAEDAVAAEELVSDAEFERLVQAGKLQLDFENAPELAASGYTESPAPKATVPKMISRELSPAPVQKIQTQKIQTPRIISPPKAAEDTDDATASDAGPPPYRRPPRGRERSREPAKRISPKDNSVTFIPASGGLMMMMPQGMCASASGTSKAKRTIDGQENDEEYVDKHGHALVGGAVRSARTMRDLRPGHRQDTSMPPMKAAHEIRPPREPRPQASSAPCYSRQNVTKGTEGGLAFDGAPVCPLDKETPSCSSGIANGNLTWDEAAASMKGGMSLIRPKALGNRRGGQGLSPQKQVPLY